MKIFEVVWKILILLLWCATLFVIVSLPSIYLDAKWSHFLNCNVQKDASICVQLYRG